MFHTYLPSLAQNELIALLSKKSKLELIILTLCEKDCSMYDITMHCALYGFKPKKVMQVVFKLRNGGWLLESNYTPPVSTMIDKLCEGKPAKRL